MPDALLQDDAMVLLTCPIVLLHGAWLMCLLPTASSEMQCTESATPKGSPAAWLGKPLRLTLTSFNFNFNVGRHKVLPLVLLVIP
jgi:hypothetical protein